MEQATIPTLAEWRLAYGARPTARDSKSPEPSGEGIATVGDTAVTAAIGDALGKLAGARAATFHLDEDPSFDLVRLQEGVGRPVVFALGFLTQRHATWAGWQEFVEQRYPESPVYRLTWGSKEVQHILWALPQAAVPIPGPPRLAGPARLVALPVVAIVQIRNKVWLDARRRADATGVVLADLLARVTEESDFVLVGHSLGARIMVTAAELMATKPGGTRVAQVHLLGAALDVGRDCTQLSAGVSEFVDNYYSRKDATLRLLYRAAEGVKAVGLYGFGSGLSNINDHDVTSIVRGHSRYVGAVKLRDSADGPHAL